jgi:hypothetical protein
MQSNRRLRALAVAFVVATAASLSATSQAQDTAENLEPVVAADSNAIEGTETEAPTVAEPERSGPVLDYEPSESISEDLSVAFPADI